jgi:hypothetical protein
MMMKAKTLCHGHLRWSSLVASTRYIITLGNQINWKITLTSLSVVTINLMGVVDNISSIS